MFYRTFNSLLFIKILLLSAAYANEISNSEINKKTPNEQIENPDFRLIELFNSNKKNASNEQNFNDLLEEIFTSDNENDDSWLSKEYINLLKTLDNKEEESYYSSLIKENEEPQNSFVFINEKNNEDKFIKDYCDNEKNALEEKVKYAQNHLFNLELGKKELSNEIKSIESKIKTNEENLKSKTEVIKIQQKELNFLRNSVDSFKEKVHSEAIILIDSLIIIVNKYFEELENSRVNGVNENKDSEKLVNNFMDLVKKSEKINDHFLNNLLFQIANKHLKVIGEENINKSNSNLLDIKRDTRIKILELLGKVKKKYEDKEIENMQNVQSEIALKEKEMENNKKFVDLLNEEIYKNKNGFKFYESKLENEEESLKDFQNNIVMLNDLIFDLNKICF
jgi:hypothetical protein